MYVHIQYVCTSVCAVVYAVCVCISAYMHVNSNLCINITNVTATSSFTHLHM